ncbi:hypothetical protein [Streptomyces sp. N35]|uniref:hypothetical protein n=1 Tax=Streptomyces sp. N35 TaxID=2795730 RepID=UPI0018F79EE0|nr:hypothetical protein [Streptomyces sp. N35]
MSHPLSTDIQQAAEQQKLGEHTHTFLPSWKKDPVTRFDIYTYGVTAAYREGGVGAIRWGHMNVFEEIYSRGGVVSRNYQMTGNNYGIYLGNWKSAPEFAPIIIQETTAVWVPFEIKRLTDGETWNLHSIPGKSRSVVAMTSEGITLGKTFSPWSTVREVGISAGSLYVKVTGKMTPIAFGAMHIPNVHAALLVAKHFQRQAGY